MGEAGRRLTERWACWWLEGEAREARSPGAGRVSLAPAAGCNGSGATGGAGAGGAAAAAAGSTFDDSSIEDNPETEGLVGVTIFTVDKATAALLKSPK